MFWYNNNFVSVKMTKVVFDLVKNVFFDTLKTIVIVSS